MGIMKDDDNKFVPINMPIYGDEEKNAVNAVLKSGNFTVSAYSKEGGKYVQEFENKLAKYAGKKYAVAVSSGTAALETALRASGIGPGYNVVIPSMTFVATANAVTATGANAVFADVTHDGILDPEQVRRIAAEDRIHCIMPVNLFGRIPQDANAYQNYSSLVIEDACQSLGTKGMGYGDVSCISFYASKIITTAGLGGAVLTDDYIRAEQLKLARNQGMNNGQCVDLGTNLLMGEMNAAFGCAQLDRIDYFMKTRKGNMEYLGINDYENTNGYLATITRRDRNAILKKLHEKNIGAAVYYDRPIHMHPFYHDSDYSKKLTMTEYLADSLISVPVHPNVKLGTLNQIKEII